MQQYRIQIGGPGPGSPRGIVARILFSIAAVAALVAAAFLGAVFFLAALGFFLVGTAVLAARIWWAKRQIEKAIRQRQGKAGAGPGEASRRREDVIEGEYSVVAERERERNTQRDGQDGH
ncbi:hypothetical protein [Wenzhouxiangella sp. XN24]|uniref:hypothetical protein n=1 Tax=Wenzhouxiangella sp. XN24 TaxID=2713569 RepID=UPI0013ED0E30|nr:hypothetical protein [Wenzhouxiangella sp. XN24]NGX16669.1 hypothetical protein [Wenzhouxiangella sp. XN24]